MHNICASWLKAASRTLLSCSVFAGAALIVTRHPPKPKALPKETRLQECLIKAAGVDPQSVPGAGRVPGNFKSTDGDGNPFRIIIIDRSGTDDGFAAKSKVFVERPLSLTTDYQSISITIFPDVVTTETSVGLSGYTAAILTGSQERAVTEAPPPPAYDASVSGKAEPLGEKVRQKVEACLVRPPTPQP